MATKRTTKDLQAKTSNVKGGSSKLATNDNLTLLRGAKPAQKDWPGSF